MSSNIVVKFKKTSEWAKLPKINNVCPETGDSGCDLHAVNTIAIPSGGSAVVSVGLTLAYITPGYWFRIEPRSGLGFKHSLQPHLGIIDNGYRGDMGVKLYNFSDNDFMVQAGQRIAQIVIYKLYQPEIEWADDIVETARGDAGFGSSGK